MKPIPTTYAGTAFRSRLEAEVAQFFNQNHIPWEYEPVGFELDDGTRYLPDFWLPAARVWAEVKGPHKQRIDKLEKFATQLWREANVSYGGQRGLEYTPDTPMVVEINACTRVFHQNERGIRFTGVAPGGRRFSAGLAQCPNCFATTVIALWQDRCRNCRSHVEFEGWHDSVCDGYDLPFRRIEIPMPRNSSDWRIFK